MKSVAIKMPAKPADPDQWVASGDEAKAAAPAEPMKRFTLDVPLSLHTRIKVQCARRGVKMADVLRELLEREFPEA